MSCSKHHRNAAAQDVPVSWQSDTCEELLVKANIEQIRNKINKYEQNVHFDLHLFYLDAVTDADADADASEKVHERSRR